MENGLLAAAAETEQRLVEARFRALVAEWDVGRSQVAALLGIDHELLGLDMVPLHSDRQSETRLRLLVEIRDLLPRTGLDVRDVPVWLRAVEEEDDGTAVTPLSFLSGELENVRAFCRVLRTRSL